MDSTILIVIYSILIVVPIKYVFKQRDHFNVERSLNVLLSFAHGSICGFELERDGEEVVAAGKGVENVAFRFTDVNTPISEEILDELMAILLAQQTIG